MPLHLYNSYTRCKQPFVPLVAGAVSLYVCGVTVYDYCHLGHARTYVVWDMVRRYLARRYSVTLVQNITDIDDKIIRRAEERQVAMSALVAEFIAAYDEDMARLNVLPADRYPRATESIPQMIALIRTLEERGIAYASGGDVYYGVQAFPRYGQLSGRSLSGMQAGASGRVEEGDPFKRYPLDFALWKAAKPHEPAWDSPWGRGRPGWHIECSAMVRAELGDSIDIHAGGMDLQFPHHENEIAQSEAVTGQPLAQFWLHNGFVNIDGEKMSKSLHNFRTIREILAVFHPMAVRWFILQAHYRQPIDFTEAAMQAATKSWESLWDAWRCGVLLAEVLPSSPLPEVIARFEAAMDDDLNTAVALAVLLELAKPLRSTWHRVQHGGTLTGDRAQLARTWQTLHEIATDLGFCFSDPELKPAATEPEDTTWIETLIAHRRQAKGDRNYAEADRIRQELGARGITLIDQPGGVTLWRRSDATSATK
ncbi:MAG: cysteine--tRNA ligase [Oscillatoriales cyanobacterium SM2_2_1]|nr:cysteine--tRNA ligase [Oscillatoriales cyanobacterium SM2_2_1]